MFNVKSSHVKEAFAGRACSTKELEDFVTGNLDAVINSYPAYDWQGAMPKEGVYRIGDIRPEVVFAHLRNKDPEYSFLQASGQMLLVVGGKDGTDLPLELGLLEGKGIRTLGHTHPGTEENIDVPSERDVEAMIRSKNKSEFIFHRSGLLTYGQPAPDFAAEAPKDLADKPRALANALYYNYIVGRLKLDEAAYEKDAHGYWKKFCTEVFGLQSIAPQNDKALAAVLAAAADAQKRGDVAAPTFKKAR